MQQLQSSPSRTFYTAIQDVYCTAAAMLWTIFKITTSQTEMEQIPRLFQANFWHQNAGNKQNF